MTLSEKQQLFCRLIAELIVWVYARGWALTFGEAYRSDEQAELNAIGPRGREDVAALVRERYPALAVALENNGRAGGIRNSLHGKRLAIDLNLFVEGVYQSHTDDYRAVGEKWESMHHLCRWGGRFNDGNHFSIEHEGVK